MSAVYIVRHGQADSQGTDYDRLTPHGKRQAFELGRYMASNAEIPDRIVTGTMRRHRETAESFWDGIRSASEGSEILSEPKTIRDAGWNEFSPELWSSYSKLLAGKKPEFEKSLRQFGTIRSKGGIRSAALFYKLTEEILRFWKSGEETPDGVETYLGFEERVFNSSNVLFSSVEQDRTFVFTSGTPISVVLNSLLNQSGDGFAWMPWIWNTSTSVFRRVRGKYVPVTINSVPHLPEKKDRTLF
ncbi:histidine phosphatase family protein [Leptospira gomenensis]|uniref:Histidine phosphatase family protein n=1 Tax=Leptospira gomenensis TaxID=2484974 RepID=A0A5F1Y8G2_9LEPT|nr:histidine phosphatase family protein [Leptospira gomenensis]TGK29454.1 histidine phosphatase family protein [Leptospira gomenensis]TGK33643.1 histidine phosphatase family protein [Leptospira gomenensis]TGK44884.1 histidine phosphatase family protein [Leptospira gomenensis]TGK64505.1 histidine phosphatase family protein [Leptospira gomenensis]